MKTNNSFIDLLLSSALLTLLSFLLSKFTDFEIDINIYSIADRIKSFFYKKNVLIFEGKRNTMNLYGATVITCTFTDRFKSLWEDVIATIAVNNTITEVSELASQLDKEMKDDVNLFIVSQKRRFIYNKELEIYAMAQVLLDNSSADKDSRDKKPTSNNIKIDRITITLYSYKTPLPDMIHYVDTLTEKYIGSIETSRKKQKFIYTIAKVNYEENTYECWNEFPFESTRTFDNIFFTGKNDLVDKLNFFINNKKWYYDTGIPYSLGIGLYGSPGTGKTSLIKCIANMTNRHIVVVSLKMLKTRNKLLEFFFEDRYNKNNKKHSIDFHKKIIVFEDIDCAGDIIKKREGTSIPKKLLEEEPSRVSLQDVVHSLIDKKDDKNTISLLSSTKPVDDPITLDDILNIWDGIQETPGRIMIISSNHYDTLDPALIRPGRIDITMEMKNATQEIIAEMFQKYYKTPINKMHLKKIKNEFYSPAELINYYLLYKNEPKKFMERLMKNQK